MLFGKDKLITVQFPISKALINSYIIHDEFVSANNVLREYLEWKKKKSWNFCEIYHIKALETCCVSCKKNTTNEKLNKMLFNALIYFYKK